MFPFWKTVIAPVLQAAGAKRIVEIGALRGETTEFMLEQLGHDAELYVIDPVPEFDPSEHEGRFPGRYRFFRDVSHNVLPQLPPMDAALVDGDHNWYTVYHELKMLERTARAADAPLPVLILHDVGWPYGRRDLYYAPERIPDEFRQPYAQQGIEPGRSELLRGGGLNPTMNNAESEGGPRNGVMTALDDFIAEHDRPLRRLVIPIYFGLAIVADEQRLEQSPELLRTLDDLEGAERRGDLLHLSEDVRLKAMLFQHNVFYTYERQVERSANRYLDLLKGALLDEHYLENELRLAHLASCAAGGRDPEPKKLRDPARRMTDDVRRLRALRQAGRVVDSENEDAPHTYFPYSTMGRTRLDHLQACLDTVRTESVEGDFVECSTGRGGGGIFLRGYVDAHSMKGRRIWVADPFRASPGTDEPSEAVPSSSNGGIGYPELLPDLNTVRDGFDRFGLLDQRVRFLQGSYADTLPGAPIKRIALLRLGSELGNATADILETLYKRITLGGFVVVEDASGTGSGPAVDEFRARHGIDDPLERVDWSSVCWRKTRQVDAAFAQPEAPARAPFAPPLPKDGLDLTVVVVFYNMRREAPRTLHSLSRAYQRGMDDVDYEVIVVENGSDPEQKLDEELVQSFGPEFRYVDLGDQARPSPTNALNRGIAMSRGRALALMIDGAHVLTPRVLRFGIDGLKTYEPAIVATQQWYVGPGQQADAMQNGYDQKYEDRLFDKIEWPSDGYRLFEIGHFIGGRDWVDGVWESNCMFVPRRLLEQSGCFDEGFSMPGGGYTNLEFYERLGSTPGVNVTTILGEGSFHQFHGGTTTNESDAAERHDRISSYAEHYHELRGRGFIGPGKPIHYVGSLFAPSQRRTKARRMTAVEHFTDASAGQDDGMPDHPSPIPEELALEFTDVYWRSLAWQQTTWLGRRVERPPMDLFTYQELIADVRPDWIVETPTLAGGRALFLASICDLVGHGRVLSIDGDSDRERPPHPRITYLTGVSVRDDTIRRAREIVGEPPNALVILGIRRRHRLVKEFELYSPLVSVGSYLVMEDTIVNGNPVWPTFGAGPTEAVRFIRDTRSDFVSDPTREKSATFNRGGFLKRVR